MGRLRRTTARQHPQPRHGRPALTIDEPWVVKGVATRLVTGIDRPRPALALAVLIASGLVVFDATFATTRPPPRHQDRLRPRLARPAHRPRPAGPGPGRGPHWRDSWRPDRLPHPSNLGTAKPARHRLGRHPAAVRMALMPSGDRPRHRGHPYRRRCRWKPLASTAGARWVHAGVVSLAPALGDQRAPRRSVAALLRNGHGHPRSSRSSARCRPSSTAGPSGPPQDAITVKSKVLTLPPPCGSDPGRSRYPPCRGHRNKNADAGMALLATGWSPRTLSRP